MTREEAIDILKDWDGYFIGHSSDDVNEALDMAIKALEQEPRWIPVSEELPKRTGWYLITFKVYGGGYAVSDLCYRKPENYWTGKDISKKVFDNDEVIAWMPLPKPYEPQESEV